MPSGTVGFMVSSGGFATFDECVAANLALPATEFDFGGGRLGLWLEDRPYSDNLPGLDGRSPSGRRTRRDRASTSSDLPSLDGNLTTGNPTRRCLRTVPSDHFHRGGLTSRVSRWTRRPRQTAGARRRPQ